MSDSNQWHYTDKTGQQAGPVSTDELISLITSSKIATSSMAWKNGMSSWQAISQIDELKERLNPQSALNTTKEKKKKSKRRNKDKNVVSSESNPYTTPESSTSLEPETAPKTPLSYEDVYGKENKKYGGIGRLSYLILRPLLYTIILIPIFALGFYLDSLPIYIGGCVIIIILSIRLGCLRFINIGMSGWWGLVKIIPIVGQILEFMSIVLPEGYKDNRKLDAPAIILGSLILIPIGAIIFFPPILEIIPDELRNLELPSE